ncbi:MAG: 50S ribosomal protein L21 [Elusimicrobiota bacterium]|jgi:large subunit ribosomal protein L21|nr:50S ribosomal protein L21 [Elusimicrobiota bacterium]
MNYAIVKTGGKQYKVQEGNKIVVEKLPAEVGQEVSFDDVLLISDGQSAQIGSPTISGAKVVAKVINQKRAPKVLIFKKRPKKGYKKLQGHRQYLTEVEITKINIK